MVNPFVHDENRVAPDRLRNRCDPAVFHFSDTSEVEPLDQVIGQKRAVKAITFGLRMKSPGYNIFVTGLDGTGKTTIIKDLVSDYAATLPVPDEWCIVNNFKDEFRPRILRTPPDTSVEFSRTLAKNLKDLQSLLSDTFDREPFTLQLNALQETFRSRQNRIYEEAETFARSKNIQLQQVDSGFQALPMADGAVLTQEDFGSLPEDQRKVINDNLSIIQDYLKQILRELNRLSAALYDDEEKLRKTAGLEIVEDHLTPMVKQYETCDDITRFLADITEDIVENLQGFLDEDPPEEGQAGSFQRQDMYPLERYRVNVLVDRRFDTGAPFIIESNPTYQNLFGQIEKRAFMGSVKTDFSMITGGSLVRANGGFLVLDMDSVLSNTFVWESLKRALLNKKFAIEDFPTESGMGFSSIRPEPIPLDVKVILVGSYDLFEDIQNEDVKFNTIFKVRADFDYETQYTTENVQLYARFIARVCQEEFLLPFTPEGVSSIIEFGEKLISDQSKLSLRFGTIMGMLKESDYWARLDKAERITGDHVQKAWDEYNFRYSLYEEKIHESYADNSLMIDVDGKVIGQVNGLAVYQIGETAFGRPSRITAETYMGESGIINIERESDLSGNTHNKGVLIIAGYLGRTFAQEYPLNLSISIAFEQNYGGVDGDSAASTELYAILSSLADLPIHQGLAVTGSVNQKGMIQAVGGVNEKIEGFFDVCRSKGLTGSQGVLIPAANVRNLMLKPDVIAAVEAGIFHIFEVTTIAQGIEILTGVPAGVAGKKGKYPAATVFGRVQKKMKTYMEQSMKLSKAGAENP
ncbi:MAG: AAA family ATPase [Pseudomonadota bacterium]